MKIKIYDSLFSDISSVTVSRGSQIIIDFLLTFQNGKKISGDLLEVGVAVGKTACLIGLHARNDETLHLVDIVDRFSESVNKIKKLNYLVHLLSSHDMDFDDSLNSKKFRFIHIDAKHDASYVWRELDFANNRLIEKGLIVLDDFFSHAYPQVTQATYEFLALHKHELVMILVGFNKAYLARPMYARKYSEAMRSELPGTAVSNGLADFKIYSSAQWPEACCLGAHMDKRDELPGWLSYGL